MLAMVAVEEPDKANGGVAQTHGARPRMAESLPAVEPMQRFTLNKAMKAKKAS